MKKDSTAAAMQSKEYISNLTIGLGLGDRNSWYCAGMKQAR